MLRNRAYYWLKPFVPQSLQAAIRRELTMRLRKPIGDVWPILRGRRAAIVLLSHYPADPRPRRAAEALAAQGANTDLICLRDGDGEPAHETYGNINVRRVRLKRHRGGRLGYVAQYAAFVLASFFYLGRRSLTRHYDLVHVHNMPDVLVFGATVPKLLGARVILDLHLSHTWSRERLTLLNSIGELF
jgi:Glycosyltransferase Family 4